MFSVVVSGADGCSEGAEGSADGCSPGASMLGCSAGASADGSEMDGISFSDGSEIVMSSFGESSGELSSGAASGVSTGVSAVSCADHQMYGSPPALAFPP